MDDESSKALELIAKADDTVIKLVPTYKVGVDNYRYFLAALASMLSGTFLSGIYYFTHLIGMWPAIGGIIASMFVRTGFISLGRARRAALAEEVLTKSAHQELEANGKLMLTSGLGVLDEDEPLLNKSITNKYLLQDKELEERAVSQGLPSLSGLVKNLSDACKILRQRSGFFHYREDEAIQIIRNDLDVDLTHELLQIIEEVSITSVFDYGHDPIARIQDALEQLDSGPFAMDLYAFLTDALSLAEVSVATKNLSDLVKQTERYYVRMKSNIPISADSIASIKSKGSSVFDQFEKFSIDI